MNARERWGLRLGILTELVERSSCKLGRTAIMKLAFLLQTLKGVPLDYNFRLYTYGPYDSDVLNDLGQAETLGAVKSKMVTYPHGYGYEFSIGPNCKVVKSFGRRELSKFNDSINWVLTEFGQRNASDLELLSTIIYADRDALERHQRISSDDLCRQVREIKPRFTEEFVRQQIASLAEKGLLLSMSGNVAPSSPF